MDLEHRGRAFPKARQIVDLYHAREHLFALARLAKPTADQVCWLGAHVTELDAGDIESLLASFRALPPPEQAAEEVRKAMAYFETNRERMREGQFRERGLFIGSGAVEAGCRVVIHQRLKLSGMRWSLPGAAAIIGLRCQAAVVARKTSGPGPTLRQSRRDPDHLQIRRTPSYDQRQCGGLRC